MNSAYRHTQIGYLMIACFGSAVAGIAVAFAFGSAPNLGLGVALAILGPCLFLFPTLTADVRGDRLKCFFGFGLIRREIPLRDVQAVSVVRNSWTYGWGLRLIPGGWLWNVSGLDAVELKLRDGRLFRIGTDEPERLRVAISNALTVG